MPSLGPTELIVILLIVVLVFGASKLGDLGGAVGRGIREFREASRDPEAKDEKAAQASGNATEPKG